jgi:hypothetical protein
VQISDLGVLLQASFTLEFLMIGGLHVIIVIVDSAESSVIL